MSLKYDSDANHSETSYKRQIRQVCGVWSEAYEPGHGSGHGYPDLQLLLGERLVPLEVKVGRLENGRLKSERIRPSQISWHDRFAKAGGSSFIVVCFGPVKTFSGWLLPSVHREVTSQWRFGWPVDECLQFAHKGQVKLDLLLD